MDNEEIEIEGATVSGICPESGKPYTIKAGDAYKMPSGALIDSAPHVEGVEPEAAPKSKKAKKDTKSDSARIDDGADSAEGDDKAAGPTDLAESRNDAEFVHGDEGDRKDE